MVHQCTELYRCRAIQGILWCPIVNCKIEVDEVVICIFFSDSKVVVILSDIWIIIGRKRLHLDFVLDMAQLGVEQF